MKTHTVFPAYLTGLLNLFSHLYIEGQGEFLSRASFCGYACLSVVLLAKKNSNVRRVII